MFLDKIIIYLFLLNFFHHYTLSQNVQNLDVLKGKIGTTFVDATAKHIEIALKRLVKQVTRYDKIDEEYKTIFETNKGLNIQQNDGKALNEQFVTGVENVFSSKTSILNRIKDKAEKVIKRYKNNPEINNFNYLNIRKEKEIQNESVLMVPSFSDEVPINLTNSFVQIPTNIYSGDKKMLNLATWTEKLDEVFRENYYNHSDDTMLYQYYGDASGFFRIYPGNLNGDPDGADLYDCRRRIWYTQTSSSPKDIVIMIDTSGSMIGNNIGIAKIAAASLIDTLQENDYFNVITINKEPKYIEECAKYLIQATKENKEIMKSKLQEIEKPNDITDIDKGLEEAFNCLESSSYYNRTSADCNRAIMLITDGIEGSYAGKEVFEKRNPKKSVRAFSFLVGRVKNPSKDALIEMSCNNRGFFYTIQTLGNVWDTVLDYLNVFSRPMTLEEQLTNLAPNYSPMYLDSTGLGMMTSVSLGVFHRTEDTSKFTGVVGTDISLYSLEEKLPAHQFGIYSHSFVINNNGFIFMHPKFRPQTGYLPAPQNVLIEHVERPVDNGTIDLKIAMLTPGDDSMQDMAFQTFWIYDGDRKLSIINGKYSYKRINNTELTAATVIIDSDLNYFDVVDSEMDKWIDEGLDALYYIEIDTTGTNLTLTNWTYVHISPWQFCDIDQKSSQLPVTPRYIKYYPEAQELYEFLKNVKTSAEISSKCDKELVKRLLLTAAIAKKQVMDITWSESVLMNEMVPIETLFVMTNGGFSRYLTNNNITKSLTRDVLKNGIFELAAALPTKPIIASASWKDQSPDISNEDSFINLAGVSRLNIGNDEPEILTTVSGMNISTKIFYELLVNGTKAQFPTTVTRESTYFDCHGEDANDTLVCAIIDYSGFIISSNQGNKYVGRFFGEILGSLVDHFVKQEIFTMNELEDTQASCKIPDEFDSASNILLTPFKALFTLLTLLFQTTSWFVMQTIVFLISLCSHDNTVKTQEVPSIMVTCTKIMPFYTFNEEKWNEIGGSIARTLACKGSGNQQYAMQTVKDTNLIFLIANVRFPACRNRVTLDHITKEKEQGICDYTQTHRRRPRYCFNATTDDDDVLCGKGTLHSSSTVTLVFALIIALIITRIV